MALLIASEKGRGGTDKKAHQKKVTILCIYPNIPLDSTQLLAITSILLAIEVLGFSTFASTYSSFLHNSEMAEVNWHLYEGQAKMTINSNADEASNYQETADSWYRLSENYRNGAELRRCSANLCFYSIIASIIALLGIDTTVLGGKHFWLIPFGVSVALLILAFVIFIREKACPIITKVRWPICPRCKDG